jgi:hypothetical protein
MTNCVRSSEGVMDPGEGSCEELEMMGIGQSQWYSYRCQDCRFETEVEDIVVDSFAVLACPHCEGAMHEIDDQSPPAGR